MKNSLFLLTFLFTISTFSQKNLPDITLKTIEGKTYKINDTRDENKIIVYAFWATWCAPCLKELDAINDVYDDWKDEIDVEVIAVSTDDSRTKKRTKPLVNGKGWEFEVLIDDNQDLKRALNIVNVPHIVVVKNNKIIHRHSGYTPGAEDELFEFIKNYSN